MNERGQVTVMIVGFFVVVGLLAVVVIDASALFLRRQQLNNAADGAALAAADALSREAVYTAGISDDVALDPRRARELVAEHLAASGEDGRVTLLEVDGDRVRLRLEQRTALAISPPGFPQGATVVADASATLRLGD